MKFTKYVRFFSHYELFVEWNGDMKSPFLYSRDADGTVELQLGPVYLSFNRIKSPTPQEAINGIEAAIKGNSLRGGVPQD